MRTQDQKQKQDIGLAGSGSMQIREVVGITEEEFEALAEKKGYMLSRGGAPDIQRAGLEIIKDIVDGVVCMRFDPPQLLTVGRPNGAPVAPTSNTTEAQVKKMNDAEIRNDTDLNFLLQ